MELTRGNLPKQILIFSIPVIASNLLQLMFNLADVVVVGRFAGAAALGSVGCTTNLVALLTSFLLGMGSAVNVLVARAIGMDKKREVEETVHTAVLVCGLVGIALTILGVGASGMVLRAMNTKEELLEGALVYIRIYFCGLPAMAIYNCGSAIYSAMGNTKKPLIYLTISGIINIILNLILVIGFHLDAAGVGLASAISQYVAATLIIISLVRCRELVHISIRNLRLVPDKVAAILKLGLPSGFQYSIFQIANVFVQTGVNSFDAVTVEGAAAAANIDTIVYDIMAAFYTACCSFIGQNMGAGDYGRMKKSYIICMLDAAGIAALIGGLLLIGGREVLSIFTTDSMVVETGFERLRIMAFSYWMSSFMDCTLAASRGIGRTTIPNIIVILGSCVFRILWIYTVFAHFHTVESLYLLYIFSWTLTALGEIAYFIYVFSRQFGKSTGVKELTA